MVQDAFAAMQKSDYQKGIFLLRSGLAHSPANRDARLVFAGIMRSSGQKEMALSLYQSGLIFHANDPLYIKVYLQALLYYHQDAAIREYVKPRLEKEGAPTTDVSRVMAFVLAQEAEANGRYAEALTLLEKYKLERTVDGCVLLSRIHARCGDPTGAANILRRYISMNPRQQLDGIYQSLYALYIECGQNADASFCALEYVNFAPDSFVARRELIESYMRDGRKAKAAAEIRSYLGRFSGNNDALFALMDYASQAGDERLASDIYGLGSDISSSMAPYDLMLAGSAIAAKNYAKAEELCDTVERDAPAWLKRVQEQFDMLRAISAHFQNQDNVAQIHVDSILNSDTIDASSFLSVARRLRMNGMDADALRVLERARSLDQKDENILVAIVELQIDDSLDSSFVDNTRQLLEGRIPDLKLLRRIRLRLASDHFIFDSGRAAVLKDLDARIADIEKVAANF
jgi:lipopolysaccharide biosynthesis regulator YciM